MTNKYRQYGNDFRLIIVAYIPDQRKREESQTKKSKAIFSSHNNGIFFFFYMHTNYSITTSEISYKCFKLFNFCLATDA